MKRKHLGTVLCAFLAAGLTSGCGDVASSDDPQTAASGSPSPTPSASPVTAASLTDTTLDALVSASLITAAQSTELRTLVIDEISDMELASTPIWDKSAFAFSKHIPSGVALDKYIEVVWVQGLTAAGGDSKKEEATASMIKQSSAPWLENAAKLKALGAGLVRFVAVNSSNLKDSTIAAKTTASLLATSDARFQNIASGFAAAIMRGGNEYATVNAALGTTTKELTKWLADLVVAAKVENTGARGGQVATAMYDAMLDATSSEASLLEIASGVGRGLLAGMTPGLSASEQKALAEDVPSTALSKAAGENGSRGFGFSTDYVIQMLNKEMVAGLVEAEKAAPSSVDYDALLLAMMAKFPVATFFTVSDPGNCSSVSGYAGYAGRGMVEGGGAEGAAASYAKSFSYAFAELIKNSSVCSFTATDWGNALNAMKQSFTESARATEFETAMNAIDDSLFDYTTGVVNGTTPCTKSKVAFDPTYTTAPFTYGKFVCLP